MEQKKITKGKLLNAFGNLEQAGYATSLVRDYNRDDIKAGKLRIKEWDYYYIGNNDYGIALTIDDNSYMGLGSVSVLDFRDATWATKSTMTFMPLGNTNMPSTSVIGDCHFKAGKLQLSFFNDGKTRRLIGKMKNYEKGKDFNCDITLEDAPEESMVIATPFFKKKHFYYNQKINCIRADGVATVGNKTYTFKPDDSFAVLDWGRGVWTYKNTWYWASLSGKVGDKTLGFNLGYGFGDTRNSTENMIFFDGVAYKTEQVTFRIPTDSNGKEIYTKEWIFTSSDKKIELTFKPILDRCDNTNALIIKSLQHQVFGRFSGTLICGEKTIVIKNMVGFAEKVTNCW